MVQLRRRHPSGRWCPSSCPDPGTCTAQAIVPYSRGTARTPSWHHTLQLWRLCWFIVSLTACNLLGSWMLLPLVAADTFLAGYEWPVLCRGLDAAAELVVAASVFATLLIAVDRFCAITDPLHYHMLVTRPKSVLMVAAGWALAAALAATAALGDLSDKPWQVCGPPGAHHGAPWNYRSCFVAANLVLCFAAPVVLLVWIYTHIYLAAQQNSERTRRNSLCGATLDAVSHSRGPSRTPSTRSTSSQIVSSLRHRISNASLFLHKEESRAAKISVVVIVLVFVCWLPFHAAALLHTPLLQVWLPRPAWSVVMIMALSNTALSPYVYLYRSRRIQREVRRLLGLPLSATKIQTGSGRRRPLPRQLQMIPPSPTVLDANFDAALAPVLSSQGITHSSPFTTLITKLFRAKGFPGEPWRDSLGSTASTSTITSGSTSCSGASGQSEASTTESESMLPRLAVPEAGS
ncbi:Alpha-1B adrenergic receptor [Chionoecetes opilio]|uniref:Alpha-1B adrenergic receptor n=1 Tax=Chionoecetes opilio TaxID=41210 RepID=A0A8J4Y4R1_CHIOP|nr:Alpha-1B adrenergic receptor [Chionoecetes opilio]